MASEILQEYEQDDEVGRSEWYLIRVGTDVYDPISLEQENAQLRGTTPPKASPTQSMASSIATALFMTPRSRMTRHESRNPAKPVNEPTEEAIGKPSMDTLDALEADLEWAEDKTPSSQGSPQPKTKPKSPRALQMNEK